MLKQFRSFTIISCNMKRSEPVDRQRTNDTLRVFVVEAISSWRPSLHSGLPDKASSSLKMDSNHLPFLSLCYNAVSYGLLSVKRVESSLSLSLSLSLLSVKIVKSCPFICTPA